jgi:hypothetical protein
MAGPDEIDGVAWKLDLPRAAQALADLRIAVKLRDPNCDVDAEYADKLALRMRSQSVGPGEGDRAEARHRPPHEVYVLCYARRLRCGPEKKMSSAGARRSAKSSAKSPIST